MTTRYTLEQIREFIACPELGDDHYGKWGAMTREQRLAMNDLIEIAKEHSSLMQTFRFIKEIMDANEENN